MRVKCELCSTSLEAVPLYPRRGIVRCPVCRLVFYDGEAKPENLYSRDYFLGGEYADYLADARTLRRNFARRVRQLHRCKPNGRLLEIGCAYGLFLELAVHHWQVTGIDICADAVQYASHTLGLEAIDADFLTLPDEPDTYDVICMWDTVEHLIHPVRYIEKASHWLKAGGILALTTGDIESIAARLLRSRWRLIHPPTHLFYFSKATLGRALEQAGLEPCEISHVGYYRSLRAILHGLFRSGNKESSARDSLVRIGGRLDWVPYLNLFDILFVVAKKPA